MRAAGNCERVRWAWKPSSSDIDQRLDRLSQFLVSGNAVRPLMTEPHRPIAQGPGRPPPGAVAVLVACIAASLALPHVPGGRLVWRPLMLLSTLAHELGHGLAAVLVGGDFVSLQVFADGSGVAVTAHTGGRAASALIAAGGLVGPALVACGLFFFARTAGRARAALGSLAAVLLLVVALVVRNPFGVVYVLVLSALLAALVRFGSARIARFGLVFLAIQLSVSVFSRSDYLFTRVARTGAGNMPSDAAQIAEALLLPYWMWGGLCGLVSLVVLALGMWLYLRPTQVYMRQ
jgi:hypothetical protein